MDRRRTAREVALEVLHRVESDRAWSGAALRAALDRAALTPADEALATELVYGTLRHRAEVDWALGRTLHRPLDTLPARIREVLRLGAYQLAFLPRIPVPAACSETVELARRVGHRGTVSLVNAVMRRLAASPPPFPDAADTAEAIAVRYSHPEWLVRRWIGRFGPAETRALCAANNGVPPSAVRLNTLRGAPDALDAALASLGIETQPSPLLPEGRRITGGSYEARRTAFAQGLYTPQDEGSMLVARLLRPAPGEVVIDACAAPGGKTTHLAALMENRGRIIACDVLPGKLETITRQCARTGAAIVETRLADASRLAELYPEAADRVLVDAPCSGLGVIRRRPEIRWRLGPDALAPLAARQARILAGAAGTLRLGGTLVYSVCTVEPEEGRDVIAAFLRTAPAFEPAAIEAPSPAPSNAGRTAPSSAGRAAPSNAGRTAGEAAGVAWGHAGTALLYPHRTGTDGFFVAALRRVA